MSTLHQSPLTRIAFTLKRAHGGIFYTDFKEENSGAVNEGQAVMYGHLTNLHLYR